MMEQRNLVPKLFVERPVHCALCLLAKRSRTARQRGKVLLEKLTKGALFTLAVALPHQCRCPRNI
jgi:hypothetical protein